MTHPNSYITAIVVGILVGVHAVVSQQISPDWFATYLGISMFGAYLLVRWLVPKVLDTVSERVEQRLVTETIQHLHYRSLLVLTVLKQYFSVIRLWDDSATMGLVFDFRRCHVNFSRGDCVDAQSTSRRLLGHRPVTCSENGQYTKQ